MPSLADSLERFSRKERNLLIRDALGHWESRLRLDVGFCKRISDGIDFRFNADDARWWIDYHISWLAGALALYVEGEPAVGTPRKNGSPQAKRRLVEGNQEDVDLVIAVGATLILVEAKAYGTFTDQQMRSKLQRLELLREFYRCLPGATERPVDFHLLLISRSPPHWTEPQLSPWRKDGKIPWIKLDVGPAAKVLAVTRCVEGGTSAAAGDHWKICPYPYQEIAASTPQGG